MCSANERRRYIVTSSLIGWAHTQIDPWTLTYSEPQLKYSWHASVFVVNYSKKKHEIFLQLKLQVDKFNSSNASLWLLCWCFPGMILYKNYITNSASLPELLTHWSPNKMAASLKVTYQNTCFIWKYGLGFTPQGPIHNILVLAMTCRRGDKPLLYPSLTQIYDAIWHN